jgi:hypothetical protein
VPFTASHAAAVLPLVGTRLPASALLIGSVAPDLPYYLPDDPGWSTHTWVGVVSVDLLIGLGAWLLWHGLLAAPALALAPHGVRARTVGRVTPGLRRRLRRPGELLVGLAVGAATHVLWDAFTHDGRLGTQHLSWLAGEQAGLAGYRWAQYASGLVGALACVLWVRRWWQRTVPLEIIRTPQPWRVARAVIVAGAALVGLSAALTAEDVRAAAFAGATRGGGTAVALAVAVAVVWRVRERPAW